MSLITRRVEDGQRIDLVATSELLDVLAAFFFAEANPKDATLHELEGLAAEFQARSAWAGRMGERLLDLLAQHHRPLPTINTDLQEAGRSLQETLRARAAGRPALVDSLATSEHATRWSKQGK